MSSRESQGYDGTYDPERTASLYSKRLFWVAAFVEREFTLYSLVKRMGELQGESEVIAGKASNHFTRFYKPVTFARDYFITFGEFFVQLADGTETGSWPLVDTSQEYNYSEPQERIQRPEAWHLSAYVQGDNCDDDNASSEGGYIFDTLIGGHQETERLWSQQRAYAKVVMRAAKVLDIPVPAVVKLSL